MKGNLEDNQQRDDFSLAASNAITILNMNGYDFSQMDSSGVFIPRVDLNYGILKEQILLVLI